MLHFSRRLLTGPLLVAAIGAGLAAAPTAAQATGVSATVQVNGYLMVRSEPALAASSVGTVRRGQKVSVECAVAGATVRGSVRTTDLWARISAGRYVSTGYLTVSGSLARCAAASAQAVPQAARARTAASPYTLATVRSSSGRVNVRSGPATSAKIVGTFTNGTRVNLVCGVVGDYVAGTVRATTAWDKLGNGYYISHAYLVTAPIKLCQGGPAPVASQPVTPEQFIAAAVPGAQLGWRQFGVPPSVTIAQAILESGWGKSGLASVDRNYFGIKCFDGNHGALANGCHAYRTQECTKAGSCFTTTATFRTYATMSHSFRDHGSFLRVNSRYKPAFQYSRSANKFIWTVWKAGYATDPNYYTKITGIMAVNKLYRYDTWK